MAQEKIVGAGAFVDLNGGDIGAAGRVAKAFPSAAAARFRELLRADEHGVPYSDGSRRSPYEVASIQKSIRALLKYSSASTTRAEQSSVTVR
jgi:hypothetical protein